MQEIKRRAGKHMGRAATLPIETMRYVHQLKSARLSPRKIAELLTTENIQTATGGHASTVKAVLESVSLARTLES